MNAKTPYLLIPVLVFILHLFLVAGYDTDDAYISFRYASNLVRGHGLTFNAGERVEGYTNFLWTLLMAFPVWLRFEPLLWARFLGSIAGCGLMLVTFFYRSPFTARMYSSLLLAFSAPLALWSFAGLETSMFAFFLTTGWLLTTQRPADSSSQTLGWWLLLLGALTRPEGLYFAGVALVHSIAAARPTARKAIMLAAFPPTLIYGGYLSWRFWYYGNLLPNTFYAKTGATAGQIVDGLRYLIKAWPWLIPILILYGLAIKLRTTRLPTKATAVLILGYLAYSVMIGGDWMPAFRFLTPIVPLLALEAGTGAAGLLKLVQNRRSASYLVSAFMIAIIILQVVPGVTWWQVSPLIRAEQQPDVLKELGLWLKLNAPPDKVIAVVPAGKIPFYSELRTIDMRGLNDLHIARQPLRDGGLAGHEKRDPDYVLALQPDYIITTGAVRKTSATKGLVKLSTVPMVLDSYPILKHPQFVCCYRPKRIAVASGEKDLLLYERIGKEQNR